MKNLKLIKISKTKYRLECEGSPLGGITEKNLRDLDLKSAFPAYGELQVTEELYADIHKTLTSVAWKKLLNWLSVRERSYKECYLYLQRSTLAADIIDELLQKAEKLNFINNDRFADLYINSLIEKGKSLPEIKSRLFQKVDNEILIDKWLSRHYTQKLQEEIIRRNVQNLMIRWKELEYETLKQKILNNLTRRGFRYYEIMEALAEQDV